MSGSEDVVLIHNVFQQQSSECEMLQWDASMLSMLSVGCFNVAYMTTLCEITQFQVKMAAFCRTGNVHNVNVVKMFSKAEDIPKYI